MVGAGIGGLATAIRLAHGGHKVTVFEKNSTPGGRCNILSRDGYTFDTGPTLLLMPDALQELFRSVGKTLEDYVHLIRLDPNYVVHFGDGSSIRMSSNREALVDELERFCPGSSDLCNRYIADAEFKYRVARQRFVGRNFLSLREFATASNLYYLFRTNTLRTLDNHARRYFADSRLRAAFTFQTMYLGLPPSRAPSVFSLLVYAEVVGGIWFPLGGMYSLIRALMDLAAEFDVTVKMDCPVDKIVTRGRRAVGVSVDHHVEEADVVVANVDLPHAYSRLLEPSSAGRLLSFRMERLNYGSAAYLLFIGSRRKQAHAAHHNVYLSDDVDGNYRDVFQIRRLPSNPSFYVCVASRTDPSLAPPGHAGVYVLVPVPHATPDIVWDRDESAFRNIVLDRLERAGFEDLGSADFVEVTTPDDMTSAYNLARGAAFGIAHNFSQVGYFRPANKAPGLENVYFCGASTAPGGGVPMVVMGSRLTAERIWRDHGHG